MLRVLLLYYIYSSLIEGEALLLKTFSTSSVVVDFSPKNYIYLLNPALKRQPIIPHLISNRSKVDSRGESEEKGGWGWHSLTNKAATI